VLWKVCGCFRQKGGRKQPKATCKLIGYKGLEKGE